jgi:hypothetical protein
MVCSALLFSILACNLPGGPPAQDFPPTPNATMTELFAQATILTPDLNQPEFATATATSQFSPTFTIPVTETPTVTFTPGASNTFTPPPTVTNSTPERSGTRYIAHYLSTPPTIDGDWGEWTTTQYPANIVVYGLGNWENSNDLEAAFRVGWDETYLYLAVKVRDDKYVQNATGSELYKGDSIELLLDADLYGDFNSTYLSSDDYQLGISPGKGNTGGPKESYLWYPTGSAGSKSQVSIATMGESGLYRIEFAVPWSILGVTPSVNKHLGFAVSVSDNDDTSSNVQQSMVSSATNRTLTNPTTWGEIVLQN